MGVGGGQEWKQGDPLQMEEGNSLKVNQQDRSTAKWVHVPPSRQRCLALSRKSTPPGAFICSKYPASPWCHTASGLPTNTHCWIFKCFTKCVREKKKRLILFEVAFTVTLQLVTANCHLLGWASECVIRKSVHLSWAVSAFLMLPVYNLPSYHSLQSQPPCLLVLKPVLPGRRRQILIYAVPLAREVETAM